MSAAETETDKSDSEEVLVNSLKAVSLKQAKDDSDDSDDDSSESYGSNDDDSDQNSDDINSVQSDKVQNIHQEQIWNGDVKDNMDNNNYSKTINNHPDIKENFLNIPVWYNSNIKVANKTVFIKSWYEKGIKVLQDFFLKTNLLVFEAFKCTYHLRNVCNIIVS